MNRLIKILNTAAFCCSLGAFVLVGALALGWAERVTTLEILNRAISNLVAGYCCCYGFAQWLQQKNRTFAIGLMVVGILIIYANIIAAQLN